VKAVVLILLLELVVAAALSRQYPLVEAKPKRNQSWFSGAYSWIGDHVCPKWEKKVLAQQHKMGKRALLFLATYPVRFEIITSV
jgi:hypothetical protein